jgi:internalin A
VNAKHMYVPLTVIAVGLVGLGARPATSASSQPATEPMPSEEQAYTNLLKTAATMTRGKDNGPIVVVNVKREPMHPFHDDDLRNVGAFKHLQFLLMANGAGAQITDRGVANLKDLKELEHFVLQDSQVTGASVSVLAGLPKLTEIELTHDQKIDDLAIVPVEHMVQLAGLDLSHTSVTGAGLNHLEGLKQLKELNLEATNVSSGLEHLQGLPHLSHLFLGNTGVDDDAIKPIEKMKQLHYLDLSSTHITDKGLVHVEGLSDLDVLDLEDTNITDAGLVHVKGLEHLGELALDETFVTPAGVAAVQRALPRCRISATHLRQGSPSVK